jgi:hypothetical protein
MPQNVVVALAPSGGVLADAIGIELFNRGFNVIDASEMSNLMARLNIYEIELSTPKNLSILSEQGIDAVLSVKAATGFDGLPQSASVRATRTSTGEIIAGLSWENGWGGSAGSIADRSMRKDVASAAEEIVDGLLVLQ